MQKVYDNKTIGEYLSKLITKKYNSVRLFCKDYIKAKGNDISDEEIRNMQNRMSQILKGAKAIQIYDFLIFADLLEVTCEEILSAGELFIPRSNRVTNYTIAFSKNAEEWEKYVNREDKLILNPDEYGNTVIDYALEFKNYAFLKYLMEEKYIWFDSENTHDYIITFGAGTSIQRRKPQNYDSYLQYELATKDELRIELISLAINNNDIEMLNNLHAREIPEMHWKIRYEDQNDHDFSSSYNENLISCISNASDEIIDYFTDEFEIKSQIKYKDGIERGYTFVYPFTSQLLDALVKNNSSFIDFALKKAIAHNKKTYNAVQNYIELSKQHQFNQFDDQDYINTIKPVLMNRVMENFSFSENGNIVRYRCDFSSDGIVTNISNVSRKSRNIQTNYLINELNDLFERIKNISV